MSIEIELANNTNAIKALTDNIAMLMAQNHNNAQAIETPIVEMEASKPKRKRRTKAEIAAAKLAEEANTYQETKAGEIESQVEEVANEKAPSDDFLDDEPAAKAEEKTLTRNEVKVALLKVRDALDPKAAREILNEVSAKSLQDVPEDQFATIVAKCEDALDGLDDL